MKETPMPSVRSLLAVLLSLALLWPALVLAQGPASQPPAADPAAAVAAPPPPAPTAPPPPTHEAMRQATKDLGKITINPIAKSFSVPGVVIRLEPPLEFAAVTKGGFKGYESLLELDCDAYAFNVACLLIGLDEKKAGRVERHFDARPVEGDPVAITVSWQKDGRTEKAGLGELLKAKNVGLVAEDWRYTGSAFLPDGRYMAQVDGTLIGFVHDPASIIEHRAGLGLNDYGAVAADASRCPPAGTPVVLTVSLGQAAAGNAPPAAPPAPRVLDPAAALPSAPASKAP